MNCAGHVPPDYFAPGCHDAWRRAREQSISCEMEADANAIVGELTPIPSNLHLVDRIRKKVEAIGGGDLQPVTREPVREPGALPLLGAE